MLTKFYKPVIKKKGEMLEFLSEHCRYFTMNSWNKSHSYANCIKIHKLGLTKSQLETAYDLLCCDDSCIQYEINDTIEDFEERTGYKAGFNGRSSGYIVLYQPNTTNGLDQDHDFEDFDNEDLKERVKLVQEFDKMCDRCVEIFIRYCDTYKVVEKTIMVPKKVRVMEGK